MDIAPRNPMTLEQFLAWEERQELRYEFDGFQPVAMTGGTVAHEMIGGTLRALLCEHQRGKPCPAAGPALKIEVKGCTRNTRMGVSQARPLTANNARPKNSVEAGWS